jgi:hypothetical protein
MHALSGIRTHDPSVRVSEDSSCLRRRGYCDRPLSFLGLLKPTLMSRFRILLQAKICVFFSSLSTRIRHGFSVQPCAQIIEA